MGTSLVRGIVFVLLLLAVSAAGSSLKRIPAKDANCDIVAQNQAREFHFWLDGIGPTGGDGDEAKRTTEWALGRSWADKYLTGMCLPLFSYSLLLIRTVNQFKPFQFLRPGIPQSTIAVRLVDMAGRNFFRQTAHRGGEREEPNTKMRQKVI